MSPSVTMSWSAGAQLLTASGDQPSSEIGAWNPPPAFRKLFFQGHLHFMTTASPLQRSRAYRAAMLECLSTLESGSVHEESLRDAHTVWSFIEAVYLVDPSADSSHISSRLADWYALNFPALQDQARAYLFTDSEPVDDGEEDDFWLLTTRLAAVGARAMASRLITARIARAENGGFDEKWASAAGAAALRVSRAMDEESRHSPLAVAEAMLAECPADSDASVAGRADGSWARWQETCEAWAEEQDPSSKRGARLVGLLKVLAGSTATLAQKCQSWEEMIVATTTYARRVLSDSRFDYGVVEVENACAETSGVFPTPEQVAGGALMDAAMGQPAEAVVRLGASMPTTWYAAHLCDLLMQSGHISAEAAVSDIHIHGVGKWLSAPGNVSLLEYLVLELAWQIERNQGMWRLAADYFTQCPVRGRKALTEMLTRTVTRGPVDRTAEKVLAYAETVPCLRKHKKEIVSSVCARIGAECVHAHNLGGAAFWFSRGAMMDKVIGVVEQAIADAEQGGTRSRAARSLENVVSAVSTGGANDVIRERISYATEYVDFQSSVAFLTDSLEERDSDSNDLPILEMLHTMERKASGLVASGGLPRKFWGVIVYEFCRVLEGEPALGGHLSTDTLHDLMSALEVITGSAELDGEKLDGLRTRLGKEDDEMELALHGMRSNLLHAMTMSFSSRFD